MGRKAINMVGKKYNKLTVIKQWTEDKNGNKVTMVKCKCDCGGEIITRAVLVRHNQTRSCGCLRVDWNKDPAKKYKLSKSGRRYSAEKKLIGKRPRTKRYCKKCGKELKCNYFYCDKCHYQISRQDECLQEEA